MRLDGIKIGICWNGHVPKQISYDQLTIETIMIEGS
jgi:hypothetical protein